MWAIISSNKVIEVTEIDPVGRYHSSISYLPCTAGVEVGMECQNNNFYFLQETVEVITAKERVWRDSELLRADEELNKVQDADPKAIGTVTQWREYRRALRNYPAVEGFPNEDLRPVSPA